MNRNMFVVGLALATCLPIAAFAQTPAPTASPDPIAMCKELRSKVEGAQSDARNAALRALSSAHRAQVQSIIDRVSAAKLDPHTAARQIDDLLTVDETKAVLAEQDRLSRTMRTLLDSHKVNQFEGPGPMTVSIAGPAPGPVMVTGPPPNLMYGGPPGMGFSVLAISDGFQCGPSAGQTLLRMTVTPEKMMPLHHP